MVRRTPKRQFVRILLSPKIEYLLYKPPYLTGIEGPPPKRNVVSSSLAGGAKNDRCKPFFDGLQRFFVLSKKRIAKGGFPFNFVVCLLIGFEQFTRAC